MATYIQMSFDGTLTEFIEFVRDTFKDTDRIKLDSSIVALVHNKLTPDEMVVERLMAHMTGTPPGAKVKALAALPDIRSCVSSGHKIQAIKALREATGCGLKEAKDAIESGAL